MQHTSEYQAFPIKPSTYKGVPVSLATLSDVVVIHTQGAGTITFTYNGFPNVEFAVDTGMDLVVYDAVTVTCTAEILMSK